MSKTKEQNKVKDAENILTKLAADAELADYSPVKGCMVIRPYGYAIWEQIKASLDKMIKDTGHENAYFPMFIPESFLQKEAEHVEGFAPECAVVTHAGGKELEEKLVARPTSETIINHMFSKWIKSYRDLPMLLNQWANVIRWEMRTRLFLRTTEFLWQEGHTAHSNREEAEEEARKMLGIYKTLSEDVLAIPVIDGTKTDNQRFAGAEVTYCIEGLMKDCKSLQMGTSHNLGQNFAKAFETKFQNKEGKLEYAYQTSWGVSTRLVGAIIMTHHDEKGLKLPPEIAPYQVVIVPIYRTDEDKEKVLSKCNEIKKSLGKNLRVKLDDREQYTPGWKFNNWEVKGVPIRINIGPRDIENNVCEIVRRDSNEKLKGIPQDDLDQYVSNLSTEIQENLFRQAKDFITRNTCFVSSKDEFDKKINEGGYVVCFWEGSEKDEEAIQAKTKANIRCIPFNPPIENMTSSGQCIITGNETKQIAVFAKAY